MNRERRERKKIYMPSTMSLSGAASFTGPFACGRAEAQARHFPSSAWEESLQVGSGGKKKCSPRLSLCIDELSEMNGKRKSGSLQAGCGVKSP